MARKWIKRDSLALNVLRKIGTVGLIAIAATSPYFGLGIVKGLGKQGSKKAWRKFYQSLNYLNRRGYVKLVSRNGDEIKARITRRGESVLERFNLDSMKLSTNAPWDGKWRVVIFDVPNRKNSSRLAFTQKLKELGFIMVQKSVWTYPFECYKEVVVLRKFYEIERFVTYLEVVEVEDELEWRRKFNLAGPTSSGIV